MKKLNKKGRKNKIVIITTVLAALTAGLTLAYYYGIKPALDSCLPDNLAAVISISGLYFISIGLLEGFVFEPLLEKWLKLGTWREIRNTHNEALILSRVIFGGMATLLYIVLLKTYLRQRRQSK